MKEGEYIVEEDPFERELSASRVGLDIRELEESVLFISTQVLFIINNEYMDFFIVPWLWVCETL